MLQMAVKVINNLVGPNNIVPILLVFGVYPQLIEIDPSSPLVTKRAEVICTITKEVCRLYTKRQVKDALAMCNSLNIKNTLDLSFQLNIYV
jgi:hypothetical protein